MTIAEQLRNGGMEEGIEKAKVEDAIKIVDRTGDYELAKDITGLSINKIKESMK